MIYKDRRDTLINRLDGIAILSSASYQTRSNDTEYKFRQNSNFYYLSGFNEDNSCMILLNHKGVKKSILFVEEKDRVKELWNGKRFGIKKAKKHLEFDEVYSNKDFKKVINKLLIGIKNIYIDTDKKDKFTKKVKKSIHSIRSLHVEKFIDINRLIYKMRLIKDKHELNLIKKAINITKKAHINAMKKSLHVTHEYELQAEIEYIFTCNGASSDAYTSIVAAGNNANTLHYISNDSKINDDNLILIDAGCEYEMYASDITRTFPKNGKFTKAQKDIYKAILHVQKKVIKKIKEGVFRSELQKYTQKKLTQSLINLKIINMPYKKAMKKAVINKYYPHGIGHFMGIDVHDQNPYVDKNNKEIALKKGMVLTIEPGLYLPKNDKSIPEQYRGIGIRIEDDILVTKNGYKNLSSDIPKDIKEIESIISK
jgi:Xaa-Pro aminopeptidase